MNFKKAEQQKPISETNDCSVKAVSILCDVPYHVAHKALKLQGRKNRKGSNYFSIMFAIKSLGFKVQEVKHIAKTMTTITRDPVVQDGYFAVFTRGHIASVVNGKVEDWTDGRRHKVKEVVKVMPKVSRKERKQRIKQIMEA